MNSTPAAIRLPVGAIAELNEAIALVSAYQDSADRAKMLATLMALRSTQ
jgi:hypothetical protein